MSIRGVIGVLGAGSIFAAMALPAACASNDPVGKGGACFVTTDCAQGLVCIFPKNAAAGSSGTCSDDLSSIQQSEAEAGADGGGGGGGGGEGGGGDSGGGGGPDTGGGGNPDTGGGGNPDTGTD